MERRLHKRYESAINAKILINGRQSENVRILDVSAGGMCFAFDGGGISLGDEIIAHLDGGARLTGTVVRAFEKGFAIGLTLSEDRRARLARTLERLRAANAAFDRLTLERRLGKRVSGQDQSVICETPQGKIEAQIVDMSLTGVGIETSARLELNSLIVVGRMRGQVVRQEGNVYGIMFLSAEEQRAARHCLEHPDHCNGPSGCEARYSACGFSPGSL